MTNPFEVLSAGHARQLELANELTGGAGDPPRTLRDQHRLAERLVMEASAHEAIEEQCFWPAVRDRLEGGRVLAMAGLQQEVGARRLLHELNRTRPGDDSFMTMVFTAASRIRDHITYEEGQLWPKLQLTLDADELDRLGSDLERAKRSAPTRPHPHVPPDARLLRVVGPWTGRLDRALDLVTGRGK